MVPTSSSDFYGLETGDAERRWENHSKRTHGGSYPTPRFRPRQATRLKASSREKKNLSAKKIIRARDEHRSSRTQHRFKGCLPNSVASALNGLDLFHIAKHLNETVDAVRRDHPRMGTQGKLPPLMARPQSDLRRRIFESVDPIYFQSGMSTAVP